MKAIDHTGEKYGRLTLLFDTGTRNSNGNAIWRCKCDCGGYKNISINSIRCGVRL